MLPITWGFSSFGTIHATSNISSLCFLYIRYRPSQKHNLYPSSWHNFQSMWWPAQGQPLQALYRTSGNTTNKINLCIFIPSIEICIWMKTPWFASWWVVNLECSFRKMCQSVYVRSRVIAFKVFVGCVFLQQYSFGLGSTLMTKDW